MGGRWTCSNLCCVYEYRKWTLRVAKTHNFIMKAVWFLSSHFYEVFILRRPLKLYCLIFLCMHMVLKIKNLFPLTNKHSYTPTPTFPSPPIASSADAHSAPDNDYTGTYLSLTNSLHMVSTFPNKSLSLTNSLHLDLYLLL